ncbi:MAG TPA: hypothetical protein VI007_09615 [bacterium]
MSANRTLSTRRSVAPALPRAIPQRTQNWALSELADPQLGHRWVNEVPQRMQKRASPGFSWPHWGQRTGVEMLMTFSVYNARRGAVLPGRAD